MNQLTTSIKLATEGSTPFYQGKPIEASFRMKDENPESEIEERASTMIALDLLRSAKTLGKKVHLDAQLYEFLDERGIISQFPDVAVKVCQSQD